MKLRDKNFIVRSTYLEVLKFGILKIHFGFCKGSRIFREKFKGFNFSRKARLNGSLQSHFWQIHCIICSCRWNMFRRQFIPARERNLLFNFRKLCIMVIKPFLVGVSFGLGCSMYNTDSQHRWLQKAWRFFNHGRSRIIHSR